MNPIRCQIAWNCHNSIFFGKRHILCEAQSSSLELRAWSGRRIPTTARLLLVLTSGAPIHSAPLKTTSVGSGKPKQRDRNLTPSAVQCLIELCEAQGPEVPPYSAVVHQDPGARFSRGLRRIRDQIASSVSR